MSRHHSTFYADGFRDGQQAAPFSPPDGAVYAIEYRKGYDDGRNGKLFQGHTRERHTELGNHLP